MSSATVTSLYIGDIPADTTHGKLVDAFKDFLGDENQYVQKITIAENANRQGAFKHGYMSVVVEKAQMILDACIDGVSVDGRNIRVNKVEKKVENRRDNAGNICIRRIPAKIPREEIARLFVNNKNVRSFKMKDPIDGVKYTIAYVHYEDEKVAQEMIEQYNDHEINGEKLVVSQFVRRDERLASGNARLRLYAKQFPADMAEDDVVKKIVGDASYSSKFVGESRGSRWMLINFDDQAAFNRVFSKFEDADSYPEECKGWVVVRAVRAETRRADKAAEFRRLQIQRTKEQEGRNLYINGLAENVTQDMFVKMMSEHGEVESPHCKMNVDKTVCLGYAYCLYKTKEAATAAMDALNGAPAPYGNSDKPLLVDYYLPPHKRRERALEAKRARSAPSNNTTQQRPIVNPGMQPRQGQNMAVHQVHAGAHGMPMQMAVAHGQYQGHQNVAVQPRTIPAAPQPVPVKPAADVTLEQLRSGDKQVLQKAGNGVFSKLTKSSAEFGVTPDRVGKITGMIVQLEAEVLFNVLNNDKALADKCKEANELLDKKLGGSA